MNINMNRRPHYVILRKLDSLAIKDIKKNVTML